MINYHTLLEQMTDPALQCWRDQLSGQIDQALSGQLWGDLPDWLAAVEGLPNITASDYDLSQGKIRIGRPADCDDAARAIIQARLMTLHPWRKGPFDLFGIHIDTEWRSDWKWARLAPHIQDLTGRRVLDVGCGNGYYMLRMLSQQARLVIGLDPGVKYIVQWQALRHFLGDLPGYALPLGIESLPDGLQAFDTVFSMGVLYHRRTPLEHLIQLKGALKPGGELILETLVIPDEYGHTLTPEGRYAKMRNVWSISSIPILEQWLEKAGFSGVRTVNVSTTTTEEQRSTQWMRFESLADFLDPDNPSKTIEGYPAPTRAIVVAQA